MNNNGYESELEMMGYKPVFDYSQFSHENHVNVIPEESFKRLVTDTFKTIVDVMKETYGPYGSTVILSELNETTSTKDGYKVFKSMGFSHPYKRLVYHTIRKICERVSTNVGDGTTSCILIADKIFNKINNLIQTPDDKRRIFDVLNIIEKDLQNAEKINDKSMILSLTPKSLKNIIKLAGNYDEDLTDVLYRALNPVVDTDQISSIRNVIVDKELINEGSSTLSYEIDFLPGDYRVAANMDVDIALIDYAEPTEVKVVLYDHEFGSADWEKFIKNYDGESKCLLIARSFTRGFLNNDYPELYLKPLSYKKKPIKVVPVQMISSEFQNEIRDLAAVLGTEVRNLYTGNVDHDKVVSATVKMHKGNALCFYNVKRPDVYIEKLKREMKSDLSQSYITHKKYMDRIKALSLENKDTLITIKAGSSLELEMISDKVDDCVAIVESAMTTGIVPNMFVYAHYRLNSINTESSDIMKSIITAISDAIKDLFVDIWISKYGYKYSDNGNREEILNELYNNNWRSFDIITDSFCDIEYLPTSTQYDIEVVTAAISIVKYLLSSRALIFDSHLLNPVEDRVHYRKV